MSLEQQPAAVAAESPALRAFSRAVSWLAAAAIAMAALALLVSLALIGWAVVMRYLFNAAPVWVDDIVGLALVAVVMLAAADTLRRGQHIGVDMLVGQLSERGRRWAQAWAAVSTSAVALLLIINGWSSAMFARTIGMVTEGQLEWPVWMLMLLLPVGGVLLLLASIELLWRALAGAPLPTPAGHAMQDAE